MNFLVFLFSYLGLQKESEGSHNAFKKETETVKQRVLEGGLPAQGLVSVAECLPITSC